MYILIGAGTYDIYIILVMYKNQKYFSYLITKIKVMFIFMGNREKTEE